jgi:hypothetical protein
MVKKDAAEPNMIKSRANLIKAWPVEGAMILPP